MPMMSSKEMHKLQRAFESQRAAAARQREQRATKLDQAMSPLQTAGAATAVGFLRGKMEKPDGSWNIPGTPIDWEAVIGLAGVGLALSDLAGKQTDFVLNASNGVLSHYMGQVARKWAKTGTFSLVAGDDMVGDYLPPAYGDPTSYVPRQISSPYADPAALALSRAGM